LINATVGKKRFTVQCECAGRESQPIYARCTFCLLMPRLFTRRLLWGSVRPSQCATPLLWVQDRIFDELNTLSVVYRAPATTFIDAEQGAGVQ